MAQVNNTVTASASPATQAPGVWKSGLTKILLPTDFSPRSERALAYALELARRLGASLTLLHVVPEASILDYTMEGVPPEEVQGWLREAEKGLANQLGRAKLAYQRVDSMLQTALHPCDEIVKVAKELSVDFMVLATHGYTGWKHLVFGSRAEKILERAPCPVFVVH
jgi:nucleotide-binding universal stress UspA family protein